ncbi:GTPase Era [Kiloniella laminariae]|uniref:GTPase Era n=1 Tax=Kiloniella laminariae TaxID=454162 RepID=UPI00037E7B5F|nr:GTPase Era [Kiloniella laminariae]
MTENTEITSNPQNTRCGFVALIGAPNAGKSTLMNRMVGGKVSIVTHKVQTTRSQIRGIAMHKDSQLIFVDTPGIFLPKKRLERAMVSAAWSGAGDAEIIVVLHDAGRKKIGEETRSIIEGLQKRDRKVILALNKIDSINPEKLLLLAQEFMATEVFSDIFMISALEGNGVKDLMDHLAKTVPAGVWLYPEDQLSDLPMRSIAAEITREKLFLNLHDELPYNLTVETESWEDFEDGSVKITQMIYVQREQHKAMCLGKGGRTIKLIRSKAQADLQESLERKVHLFLYVKVREKWADDPERYREMGLDFNS